MAMATATLIGLGIAGASAAYQAKKTRDAAKSSEQQGVLLQQGAESQAGMYDFNARIAALQAVDAIERGKEEEARFRRGVDMLIGAQRAGFAAGNIDVGFGSAVDVQADAAYLGELDALQIRTNAAREAWGFNVQAEDYRMRAEITRREGVNLRAGANEQASQLRGQMWGGLLQTGSSLLMQRYGFGKPPGAPPPPRPPAGGGFTLN